jgi:serine/threonine protein phosphatase PrpC
MRIAQSKNFDTGAATHVGKVRGRNEDSYLTRPEVGIWAVADGMGGHDSGDLASQTVIDCLRSIEPQASATDLLAHCEESIAGANRQLKRLGRERGVIIGATLAALLVYDGYYACIWSGDSRIYLVREGGIVQLSRDHTEVQDLVVKGAITAEEARNWSGPGAITRAIGVYDDPGLELVSGPIQPGDAFVICSDGLTNHVADGEIRDFINGNLSQQACDGLVALALERGGIDNVTVIIARHQPVAASSADLTPSTQTGP